MYLKALVLASGVVFTYLLSSVVLFLFAARLMKLEKEEASWYFFLFIGLGPVTISWLLTQALKFFPHRPDVFYILFVMSFFAAAFLFGWSKRYLVTFLLKNAFSKAKSFRVTEHWPEIVLSIIVIIMLGSIIVPAGLMPVTENDATQYATISRLIYAHKTLSIYPFVKADPQTGFYEIGAHPLGYNSMITWSYMLQGGAHQLGLGKLVSPAYVVYTALLLWYVLLGRGSAYSVIGVILLLAAPIYSWGSVLLGIDSFRVFTFFLSFVSLYGLIRSKSARDVAITGYCCAMSTYSHALGLITLPFLAAVYMAPALLGKMNRRELYKKMIHLLVIAVITFAIAGDRYMENIKLFGYPVYDTLKVNQLKELRHEEFQLYENNMTGIWGRIKYGEFNGFSKYDSYGITYWVFLAGLLLFLKKREKDPQFEVFLWAILLWHVMVAVTIVANSYMFVTSDRYFQTIQPFVAYGGALALGYYYERFIGPNWIKPGISA